MAREEALFYQRGDLTEACLRANRIDSVNRGTEVQKGWGSTMKMEAFALIRAEMCILFKTFSLLSRPTFNFHCQQDSIHDCLRVILCKSSLCRHSHAYTTLVDFSYPTAGRYILISQITAPAQTCPLTWFSCLFDISTWMEVSLMYAEYIGILLHTQNSTLQRVVGAHWGPKFHLSPDLCPHSLIQIFEVFLCLCKIQ